MRRFHLFEFEDQSWFPRFLRNYMTDFLQFVSNQFDFYKGVVPVILKGLKASGTNTIIDLASGGGGGWRKLSKHLKEAEPEACVMLSDYYPNITAFKKMESYDSDFFKYHDKPVSALEVPKEFKGLRTQFLSLHHFKPEDAQKILQNAVDNKMPIAIFEGQERNVRTLIQFMLSPINVVLTTPFIRPFKLGRIIFTYLIPIVPLCVGWDGAVSVLRTYSNKEMKAMIENLNGGETFEWEVGKKKSGMVSIQYTLGIPKSE